MINKIISLILLVALFSSCQTEQNDSPLSALPYYDEANFTPKWFDPNDSALESFHKVSSFELTNQDGKTITEADFENKIYVTDFFFTICPGICPKMTESMGILQAQFLDDPSVLLLSHSVTPEIDSVPRLRAYAETKGIDSRKWHIVTGDVEQIYKLGRQDYFVEESLGLEKEEDEFLHTENFVLIDKQRHIRGIYNGLRQTSIDQLISDIQILKKEGATTLEKSGQGQITAAFK